MSCSSPVLQHWPGTIAPAAVATALCTYLTKFLLFLQHWQIIWGPNALHYRTFSTSDSTIYGYFRIPSMWHSETVAAVACCGSRSCHSSCRCPCIGHCLRQDRAPLQTGTLTQHAQLSPQLMHKKIQTRLLLPPRFAHYSRITVQSTSHCNYCTDNFHSGCDSSSSSTGHHHSCLTSTWHCLQPHRSSKHCSSRLAAPAHLQNHDSIATA